MTAGGSDPPDRSSLLPGKDVTGRQRMKDAGAGFRGQCLNPLREPGIWNGRAI